MAYRCKECNKFVKLTHADQFPDHTIATISNKPAPTMRPEHHFLDKDISDLQVTVKVDDHDLPRALKLQAASIRREYAQAALQRAMREENRLMRKEQVSIPRVTLWQRARAHVSAYQQSYISTSILSGAALVIIGMYKLFKTYGEL